MQNKYDSMPYLHVLIKPASALPDTYSEEVAGRTCINLVLEKSLLSKPYAKLGTPWHVISALFSGCRLLTIARADKAVNISHLRTPLLSVIAY